MSREENGMTDSRANAPQANVVPVSIKHLKYLKSIFTRLDQNSASKLREG
jgi:hypothetical protein